MLSCGVQFSMKKELLQEIPTANMDTWLGKHKVLESLYMWSMDAELGDNPQVQQMYVATPQHPPPATSPRVCVAVCDGM